MDNSEIKTSKLETVRRTDLSEICSDCFTLILQLRRTSEFGDQKVLKDRILSLLNRVERRAKEAKINSEQVQFAIFALVAFLDETIISSEWSQKNDWLAKPLQLEYYNRYDAGEEFFNKLDELCSGPHFKSSVLEVYYLCLALGFKGKYRFQERDKIQKIKEETYDALRNIKGRSVDVLSPHGHRKDDIAHVVTNKIPIWIIVISAIALGFTFYMIMSFLISEFANDIVRMINNIV